jgi:hypothetical protein
MANKSISPVAPKPFSDAVARSARQGSVVPENEQVILDLERLKDLSAGWDHAVAEQIDPQTISGAQEFVRWLPDALERLPKVVPMTRGRLQLEWHQGARSLEIEFESASQVHYLKWDNRDGTQEEDVLPVSSREKIRELIQWFHAGVADDRSARA